MSATQRNRRSLLALCAGMVAAAFSVCGADDDDVRILPKGDDVRVSLVQDVPGYNSWPMVAVLGDKIICAYSRGTAHTIGEGQRGVYAKTSDDGGRTWGEEVCVVNDPSVGEVTIGKGLDNDGAMLLWVRRWGKAKGHDLYRTTDGVKFEKISSPKFDPMPMQVTDVFNVPGAGLMSLWFAGAYNNEKDGHSWGVLTSADNGRTWMQSTIEGNLSKADWPTEQSAVYLGGGRIIAIARTEARNAQFQLTSTDNGKTWHRERTNIKDVFMSTPSLVFESETGIVYNYYYQRGAKKLKRRVAKADYIFSRPTEWPEPEVLAEGNEVRPHDAGNVNAVVYGDRHVLATYSGSPTNAAVFTVSVRCAKCRPMDVMLMPNGDIRFGEDGDHVFRMFAFLPGWQALSTRSGLTIEKSGSASFSLAQWENPLLKASSNLEQLPGGKVKISYSFAPVEDVTLAALACAFSQPSAELTGKSWRTPKRTGTFRRPANGGIHVMGERGTEISVPLGATGRTLTFIADRELDIAIQDNWRWDANYALRLGTLAQKTWKKGEVQTYAFTVSADEPLSVKSYMPTVVTRSPDWIPLNYRKEIKAGSALDFSHMGFTDAPAGKYGWLKNVGGHFEFERRPGKPVKLYGVNLCGTANFPTHDESEMMIMRFKRLGYNTIRLHHYDAGTVYGSNDGLTLNRGNMDRFDYLIATAIREGLYLTTDLFVSRHSAVKWRHIGIDRDGQIDDMAIFKALCALYEPAFENWCAYAKNLMTHVNPYTGRAYRDEPALSLVSLVNEGSIYMGLSRWMATDPILREAWREWVLEKRAADPSFFHDADPDNPPKNVWQSPVVAVFAGETEAKFAARMKSFLRGIGCKALFTNNNCAPHNAPLQRATAEYDYIDDHFYVDHPQFIQEKWRLPSRCGNLNPVLMGDLAPCTIGFTRMADKPFTVTEWNFAGPGMYRGVGGIMTGALASLQDWDGLWRFAYAHSIGNVHENPKHAPGYFDLSTDPLGQASDRASILLFLRGDMAPLAAERGVSLLITPESEKPSGARPFAGSPSWRDAAWNMRVSSCLSPQGARGARVVNREDAEDDAVTNWVWSVAGDPAVRLDREKGTFTIDTPRTCGGFVPDGGIVEAGALRVEIPSSSATVWVSSLDGAPVPSARCILLTHLTDVQGEGATFADSERKVLLKYGRGALVRNGTAHIFLSLADPAAYVVYELETSGRRLGTVHAEVRDGKLAFTASVDGPNGARMLYEIVRKGSF